ncbi:HIT family protein [Candidatus Uhrbacteria bacterium]|nr:HIT family protein [Candidatus Uhrbacteria bacterium]
MPSIFSKIISREIPAYIIYEDDRAIAFLDINPVNPGHTLVVPKEESPNILESSKDVVHHLLDVVQKLAPVIVRATESDGCTITANIGEASGQTIFHTHVHIIPRKFGDGHVGWTQLNPSSDELSLTAQKIKEMI